jgi:Transcription factor zinc-finger
MFLNRATHLRHRSATLPVAMDPTGRKCPRCREPIQPVHHPTAIPSFCRGCDGFFVPGPDVDTYFGPGAAELVKRSEATFERPQRSSCPSGCEGDMQHRRVGNAAFECCPHCDGLWFERGMVDILKSTAQKRVAEAHQSALLAQGFSPTFPSA